MRTVTTIRFYETTCSKRFESEKITLYSCAAEDIFLLKSVTEREGDTADCNRLIQSTVNFDWNCLIDEINIQLESNKGIWITYIVEKLMDMNFDKRFPNVFDKISTFEEKYLNEWSEDFEKEHHK